MIKGYLPIGLLILIAVASGGCRRQETPKPPLQGPVGTPQPDVPQEKPPQVPSTHLFSPMESIKELDKKIESYKTGANLTSQDIEGNKRLKQEIIRGTFNIYELCKLALASHWNEITEKDRTHFVELMTNLLEKKAIFSKEQIKGAEKPYRIVYKDEKFTDPEKKRALVTTTLYVPSEKIDLNINYQLSSGPSGWNIYDVIVDDASLVENYKFQFDTIIRKNGFPDLVSRMEKKLKEME